MLSENTLVNGLKLACAEARKWLGATSPNPAVGAAALDSEGKILAVAAHHRAGESHAEAALLKLCEQQNLLSKIHTLCVTLEPCNHQGRTPPCAEAIIKAGIKRVVVGTRDPNPHVKGGGIERLREAGVEVACGVNEEECKQLIAAFSYRAQTGKPFITIKRAFNRDGSMVPPKGEKTFTSPDSLRLAHQLRKKADAIITGSGTVLADNPLFTIRHVEDYSHKRRWLAIMDKDNTVPQAYLKAAKDRGVDAITYQDINKALEDLTNKGVQDILVETGPTLAQAMLDSHLWAMSVTIRKADPDKVDVEFNPREPIPFTADQFRWDWVLPEESDTNKNG